MMTDSDRLTSTHKLLTQFLLPYYTRIFRLVLKNIQFILSVEKFMGTLYTTIFFLFITIYSFHFIFHLSTITLNDKNY